MAKCILSHECISNFSARKLVNTDLLPQVMTNVLGTYWNALVFQEPPSTMKLHLSLYSPGDLIPEMRLRIHHPNVIIRHQEKDVESSASSSCSTGTLREWTHK